MDQSLVHTFPWGNSYGPMVLKVLLKIPPTLVLVHGWLFPGVATPAEPHGLVLVKILGGDKLLIFVESAGGILLSGLRGAKHFIGRVSDRFSDLFSRFFKLFFVSNKKKFGGKFRSADVPPYQNHKTLCLKSPLSRMAARTQIRNTCILESKCSCY